VENGGCWWFIAEMLSKLDLQDSARISSIRTFLLRSPVFFDHSGHSTCLCSSLMFGACWGFSLPSLARVGHPLLLRSRMVTIWTPEGRPT
jgi:hypothetical protein